MALTPGRRPEGSAPAQRTALDMSMSQRGDGQAGGPSHSLLSRAAHAFRHAGFDASSDMEQIIAGDVEGGAVYDTWIGGSSIFDKWLRIGMSRFSNLRAP